MYASRTTIKSQVLADFIAEWTKVQTPLAIANQELDEVLRRIADEVGRRCGAGLHISPQGTHEVHGSSPFPLIQ